MKLLAGPTTIIDAAEKMTSLSDADRNVIVGEARFVRAFVYFRLVQAFGDCPLSTNPLPANLIMDCHADPSKRCMISFWPISILLRRMACLPVIKPMTAHANHWAAAALLGKVYLTMASAKETAPHKTNRQSRWLQRYCG